MNEAVEIVPLVVGLEELDNELDGVTAGAALEGTDAELEDVDGDIVIVTVCGWAVVVDGGGGGGAVVV